MTCKARAPGRRRARAGPGDRTTTEAGTMRRSPSHGAIASVRQVAASAVHRLSRRTSSTQLVQSLVLLWAAALLCLAVRDYFGETRGLDDGEEGGGEEVAAGAPKLEDLKGNLYLVGHKWCYDRSNVGSQTRKNTGARATLAPSARNANATNCICETGFTGDDCDVPICEESCGDHGKCFKPNKCQCRSGWRGRLCDEPICSQSCRHGECVGPNTCSCTKGWVGPTCIVRCEYGKYQANTFGPNGKPIQTCQCDRGWSGMACMSPTCAKHGCVNGKCTEPDVCVCDTGWAGPSCKVDVIAPNARNLIANLGPKEHAFHSLMLSKASKPEAWVHMRSWLSFLPDQYSTSRFRLIDYVPAEDEIIGKRMTAKKEVAERWDRCAVVGDSAGLLHTELGELIDKHAAILRFNVAPTSKFEKHVGKRTTMRMLNRRLAYSAFKRAFANKKANHQKGMIFNSGLLPATDGADPISILWRPETYHLYNIAKRRFPNDEMHLLRTEFVELCAIIYEGLYDRMVEAGIISRMTGAEILAPRPNPDKSVVHGLYRLPTAFVGVMMMMQLCRVVNVFGFDPPSQRKKVKELGLPGFHSYYPHTVASELAREDMDATVFTSPAYEATLDEEHPGDKRVEKPRFSGGENDTASVDADGVPNAKLASLIDAVALSGENLTAVVNAGVPGGEYYPGHGGPAGMNSFMYAALRLFEVHGLIQLCSTMNPERCAYRASRGTWQRRRRRRASK